MYEAFGADTRAAAIDTCKHVVDRGRLELARVLGDAVAAEDHRGDGCASMEAWVCERLAVSRAEANELVRMALRLPQLPLVVAALEAGELSWEQAVRVVELVELAGREAHWVELGRGAAINLLDTYVRSTQRMTRDQAELIAGDARLSFRPVNTNKGPMRRVSGLLPAEEAEAIETALRRIVDEHDLDRDADGGWRSRGQQLVDALVHLAHHRLGADADQDRATIVIHTEAAVVDGGDGWARLVDGTPLASETVQRYCCDARFQWLVVDDDGNPLAASQIKRAISAQLERAVRWRDHGQCRFPRCTRAARHTHHIVWWSKGGLTVAANLVSLCARHHRQVHEGRWSMTGTASDLVITRPDGTTHTGSPPPPPPTIRERIAGLLPRIPTPQPAFA